MRLDYQTFLSTPTRGGFRQYVFVATLPDPPGDESPIFGHADRVWAIVDDPAVIEAMRVYVPAEDRIYVAGVGRRIDYDATERPVLIVHDIV